MAHLRLGIVAPDQGIPDHHEQSGDQPLYCQARASEGCGGAPT